MGQPKHYFLKTISSKIPGTETFIGAGVIELPAMTNVTGI